MHFISSLLLTLFLLACFSCGVKNETQSPQRQQDEADALPYLNDARQALQQQDFAKARGLIGELRKQHPYALQARAQGILVMDSVELLETQAQLQQMDSLMRLSTSHLPQDQKKYEDLVQRVKFYLRKIHHDQQQNLLHE